jgi:chromate transporter
MQRDLVERRRWFTESEFSDGLALSQISPGPLAAQLAMYLGWLRSGSLGATLVGAAFVTPPFLMVFALSVAYVHAGELPWLRQAFAGVGAGVVCILARSALKLGRSMLQRDGLLWVIAGVNGAAVFVFQRESIVLLLISGATVAAARAAGKLLPVPVVVPPLLMGGVFTGGALPQLGELFAFFAQAGVAVFGSGLAIIPFLYAGVVQQRDWLTEAQFVDAIAVSMVTPGPIVITATFIGFIVAATPGAIVAAIGVFLPAYIIVLAVAPRFASVVRNESVRLFTRGVTAATTGAIGGAAALLSLRMLTDIRTVVIAGVVLFVLVLRMRLPEPVLIVGAGALGIAII